MRIAFFGGSFDPPHCGHIAIAKAAVERLALDRVLVAPVGSQPLKSGLRSSSFEDRLAMVQLAVKGDPHLSASALDAPRSAGEPNYTLDTLMELRSTLSLEDALFFLAGADAFSTIRQWHRAAELMLFCDFIVASRPGFSLQDLAPAFPKGVEICGQRPNPGYVSIALQGKSGQRSTLYLLPDLAQDVSATEIRAALAQGTEKEAASMLTPEVIRYIREHRLYREF